MSKTKRRKPSKGDLHSESKLVLDFYLSSATVPTLSIAIAQRGCLVGFEKTNMKSFGKRFAENKILSPQDRLNFREFCIGFVKKIDELKHDNNFWLKEIAYTQHEPYINEALKQALIQRKNNLQSDNDND